MSQILAYGKLFSQADYDQNPAKFSALLSQAKAEQGYALCKCTAPAPKLVIRCKSSSRGPSHYLATWPNQGSDHNPSCNFFVSDNEYQKANTKRLETIQEDAQGYHIKAGFPLEKLLHHLWQYAGLNLEDLHTTRTWGAIVSRLNEAATQGDIGGTPLDEILYTVPPFHATRKDHIDRQWINFAARLKKASTSTSPVAKKFFLLGEIKATENLGNAISTSLRHHAAPLYMSHELADETAKDYPVEVAHLNIQSQPGRVLGLFLIEITERNNLWVNDATLMLLSEAYRNKPLETK